ncbi:MAG: iron ABC transporter permease [Planctomycetes bacterium]|nr:iron ABC transporter permease [Planctomycetota bacterium]
MDFSRRLALIFFLTLALGAAMFLALGAGEYAIDSADVFRYLWARLANHSLEGFSRVQEVIIWRLRTPRMLLALGAGLALAVSGVAYQGCFRNPLVEPYILGVSSGAACGAALAIVYPSFFPQSQINAFVFALAAVSLAYFLARRRGEAPTVTLALSGIIVGSLFSAAVGIMKYLSDDAQLREITFWMMGGLHYATWDAAVLNLVCAVPSFLVLWGMGWKLNLLALGDEESRSLGLNPPAARLVAVLAATLMAAVAVSLTGIIAWVGLMMPHAARMLFGPDARWVIPGAALMGGVYLLVCDTLARTLTGAEIPIGIVTSIVGAPYLLWLLRAKSGGVYGV